MVAFKCKRRSVSPSPLDNFSQSITEAIRTQQEPAEDEKKRLEIMEKELDLRREEAGNMRELHAGDVPRAAASAAGDAAVADHVTRFSSE